MKLKFLLVVLAVAFSSAHAQNGTPVIDKIDPPNWWVDMPSPMLLIHGEHLSDTKISVDGKHVSIEKKQVSDNGHWAFLWLRTTNASPQTLHITASNQAGKTEADFQLQSRKPKPEGFQGFSSADVMYLIMTDRFADGDPSNDEPAEERAKVRGWHGGDFKGGVGF